MNCFLRPQRYELAFDPLPVLKVVLPCFAIVRTRIVQLPHLITRTK